MNSWSLLGRSRQRTSFEGGGGDGGSASLLVVVCVGRGRCRVWGDGSPPHWLLALAVGAATAAAASEKRWSATTQSLGIRHFA